MMTSKNEYWDRYRAEKCAPIFEWIKAEFKANLRMPTLREMMAAGHASSSSHASLRYVQMTNLGWLEQIDENKSRGYKIKGAKVIFEGGDAIES